KCKERLKSMENMVESKENESQRNPKEIWLFLDEFNTSPDIGWFNELICNRSLDGVKIPDEIKILAACNPYRERKLNKQENEWFGRDHLAQYAYRVFPLCETVKAHLWQFGSLPDLDERQYILEMIKNRKKELKRHLQTAFDNEVPFIVDKICKSQAFVRTKLQDVATVSLRDVDRCLKIFIWLVNKNFTDDIRQCLVISMGVCYYYRLKANEREEYQKVITKDINFLENLKRERDIDRTNGGIKGDIICIIYLHYHDDSKFFVLVGDPGTSKTLSFQILKKNMCQSEIANFRKRLKKESIDLKALHVVSFQCTQNSKAFRIQERWDQAMSHSDDKLIKLLLLDEIGLAEHSKHSPLKVLHYLLENPKISFVGLSNWPLDAAKMNRVIVHQIPNDLDNDLKAIGEAIYKTEHTNLQQTHVDMLMEVFKELHKQISEQYILSKSKDNWLGRRDFYALIRHYMHNPVPSESFQGIMRNLGGCRDPQFQRYVAEILESVSRKSATE
ncbi:hypothetical protein RFI_29391, partial [Reticulomyxa filosa]